MSMTSLLFIDDDAEIRNLFGPYLKNRLSSSFEHKEQLSGPADEVILCQDVPEALEVLKEDHNFDVIICDYRMPEKNGSEVWQYVRESNPDIPFILFTSEDLSQLSGFDESFQSSGNVWVQKPTSPEQLYEIVSHLLKTSKCTTGQLMS